MPSYAVKLSAELIQEARQYGSVYSRSVPKQIEYWSRIGRIAEENPDLAYAFIKEILLAKSDVAEGELTAWTYG